MPDKRRSERVPMLGHVAGEITVVEPLAVKDVSLGGLTVETRIPLTLNSLHDVRLTIGSRSVIVKSRVVHVHVTDVDRDEMAYRSGLEFVDPPEHVRTAIAEFLAAVTAARRPSAP